ncbi:MAG TPA: folylpolyglutamate synthase/dihydrofolate synthase family protein [Puia sp.]|nr:folylpolyglutamate synthase/dihydrofolate synthase family protein [Puia sp.]
MDYQEAIDYLYSRLPMFSRIGAAAYKADLGNTQALCEILDNPQNKFKSIHVGGTNGKGSVSHMLAAVFQTAGYKTGLYTSPHLRDFRERIKIDGRMIDDGFVTEFVDQMQMAIVDIQPSFFELTVAMAFSFFAEQKVDVAVVEVGLGGRLDSTNIIRPELSVITNIGYDHMDLLGDTLEKIAFEKAGIIKPGIPVVVGEYDSRTAHIFEERANLARTAVSFADRNRYVSGWSVDHTELVAEITSIHNNEKNYYHLDLTGIYQNKNLVTVLEAASILRTSGWNIQEKQCRKALREVKRLTGLHGRWEIIATNPAIVLDVAHNEDGIKQISKQIEITDHEELHIVFGMVKDKDFQKILSLLPKLAQYYFTKAQIPRALAEEDLAAAAASLGIRGNHYPDVNGALQAAVSAASKKDLIVVCGSVFVVGEVVLPS